MKISMKEDIIYREHDNGTVDTLYAPAVISKQQKRRNAVKNIWNKLIGIPQTVYSYTYEEFTTYEVTPTKSVRNNQTDILAKVIASFYKTSDELTTWGDIKKGNIINIKEQYKMNFRIVLKAGDIAFYILLPTERAGEILRKAESVYDSNITIKEVDKLTSLDSSRMYCSELKYRKHDIFSLETDKGNNYPLPSLLSTVHTLEGDDVAVFDAMIEPYSRVDWYKEAKHAHNLLDEGHLPDNSVGGKLLRVINDLFNKARIELLELTRFTTTQKQELEKWKKEESQLKEAYYVKEHMSASTKKKQNEEVVKAHLRIAVQSDSPERARGAVHTLANAWKDISEDNELERVDVPQRLNKRYWDAIENRKSMFIGANQPIMSTSEAGKLLQLPGKSLLEEFSMIRNQLVKEVSLPDELCQDDIKSIRIGYVTERGSRKLARIPLEEYTLEDKSGKKTKVPEKAVYDAVCTTSFGQGKQGSGKSEGYGAVMAYDMIMAGFTTIITDTADGEVLRNLVNSLPDDFPDDKIHAFNIDNKAYPIPLDWSDVYGREFTAADDDEELQALEISERLTQRFVGFIDSLKRTHETFSDRMSQYVNSSMRAITTGSDWSFLNLELCLTSPSYREELLNKPEVQKLHDVVRDLKNLQDRVLTGADRQITDPILSRLKELSSTQFMTNLFYQSPKLDNFGKPLFNLRKIMDNPEGGYGHIVVIQASFDAWQEAQSTILGFMEDKINFNAFSRIDIPQAERKPVLKWIDEPHKIIRTIEDRIAGTAVEFRKYRIKSLYTNHSIDQMGKASNAILDGGAQITSYKTERPSELKRFEHTFNPYDDARVLYDSLPDKHVAINKVRLASGKDSPAFIAEMVKPPKFIKNREYIWDECAKRYGRHWREVRESIQNMRSKYHIMDEEWLEVRKDEIKEIKKKSKVTIK